MRISVVTVAFNSERTIGDTLASVASQTWPDVEHILIDGGSTDGTLRLARTKGSHLARVISEPDRGIYDAMNKGIKHASGELVAFLNGDDLYAHPDVLRRVAEIVNGTNLDMVFGDVEFFDPQNPSKIVRRYRSDRFRPDRLAWGWMPAHPAMFVRRALFDRVGPFALDFRIAGDYEWIARAFQRERIRYRHINESLVRMRPGGVSNAGWRSKLLLNREVIRACRMNGIRTGWLRILSKYPAKILEFRR
jgi:glycosyltransferase involved in cell wall biosynthesis